MYKEPISFAPACVWVFVEEPQLADDFEVRVDAASDLDEIRLAVGIAVPMVTQVAHDASITESVMLGHYVDETDEELWMNSHRTFERTVASLPAEVAQRYGYSPAQASTGIAGVLQSAIDRQDWEAV